MKDKYCTQIPLFSFLIFCLLFSSHNTLIAQVNPNPSTVIDNFIQAEMNTERFPGVSTIIVKNGEVVWLESYGFADIQNNKPVEDTTIFLLASLSKVFTGTAMMQLFEKGMLDLDEDVNNFLPWDVDVPGFVSDSITFRQLMTHTASIDDNDTVLDTYYDYPDPTISLADCMQRYFATTGSDYSATNNFLNNKPGTVYQYSNVATALNGYMCEVVAEIPFDDLCNTEIFQPLQMTKTAWFMADLDINQVAKPYRYQSGNYLAYPHYGFADYPDGQLRSSVRDIGNFMIAYLNGGMFGTERVLTSQSINEMWSAQIPSLEPTQGLNWYQDEFKYSGGTKMLWGHNGGEDGVSTEMYMDPESEIGVCVLTNGEGDAFAIAEKLYDYALTLNTTTSNINLESNALSILPNPTSGYFTIKGITSDYNVSILNAMGQIFQSLNTSDDITIDISDLPDGLFFVSIQNKTNSKVWIQLILKQ